MSVLQFEVVDDLGEAAKKCSGKDELRGDGGRDVILVEKHVFTADLEDLGDVGISIEVDGLVFFHQMNGCIDSAFVFADKVKFLTGGPGIDGDGIEVRLAERIGMKRGGDEPHLLGPVFERRTNSPGF